MKKRWGSIAASLGLVMVFLLGGCGSADKSASNVSSADSGSGGGYASDELSVATAENMAEVSDAKGAADGGAAGGEAEAPASAGEKAASRVGGGVQVSSFEEGLNKKLIYEANVTIEVEDFNRVQSEIRNLVTLTGGYIVEFSENQSDSERGGTFILKVPASGFSSFLDELEKLKSTSFQQSIRGQDVSEEYVDLESRLKVKQAMEARYLKFVNEATKTDELVKFANELERIQTEIEQIKGRMRFIDNHVAFSTVEIRVFQPLEDTVSKLAKEQPPLLQRAEQALSGSLKVISMILQWIVIVLAGALPLILIAALIVAVYVPVRKKRRKSQHVRNSEYPESPDQAESDEVEPK
ncbi:DUF4349 domain-containing protein [Paenibacillus sp. alder61]|uniref:DUF4349 domain-containing protein n=1 Tax=Paenibacillus sp. alder61 TaxID=2862948 RepID=UPI001CD2989D|nr:DUF4349 domain-containing protein [Paenibacillus sp. alder61]MCA1295496.1 DUF4349 domain-containing protein [Paenibacillus sp. alder61]